MTIYIFREYQYLCEQKFRHIFTLKLKLNGWLGKKAS